MSLRDEIIRRYKRKVIAFPDGTVVHNGDCGIYTSYLKICTCGLHHMLIALPDEEVYEVYPAFYNEETNDALIATLLKEFENNNLYTKVGDNFFEVKR